MEETCGKFCIHCKRAALNTSVTFLLESFDRAVLPCGAVHLPEQCGCCVLVSKSVTIQVYFPRVLFIMLYKVLITFESVIEILKCYHSYESY